MPTTASMIAARIKAIFEKEVVPQLEASGMMPESGILGLKDPALYADITRFTQQIVAFQKGYGYVACDEQPVIYSMFKTVVQRLFGQFFQDKRFNPKLSESIPAIIPHAPSFSECWSKKVGDDFLSVRDAHFSYRGQPSYLYTLDDMHYLVKAMRVNQLEISGERDERGFSENKFQAVVLDP